MIVINEIASFIDLDPVEYQKLKIQKFFQKKEWKSKRGREKGRLRERVNKTKIRKCEDERLILCQS